MKLAFISCHYEKPELSAILRESCKLFDATLYMTEAAELNGKWPESGDMRIGKMKAALEFLPGLMKAGYTHVLWLDGFDTFLRRNADWVTHHYEALGCPPLLFSAEKNCWPNPEYAERYPQCAGEYRFINAGTWIAHIGYMRDQIPWLLEEYWSPNDQFIYTDAFLQHSMPGAMIDTDRRIFQTMWGTEKKDISPVATVIHYNGGIWRNADDKRYVEHWREVKEQWREP